MEGVPGGGGLLAQRPWGCRLQGAAEGLSSTRRGSLHSPEARVTSPSGFSAPR